MVFVVWLNVGLIIALNCFSVDWAIRAHNALTVAKLAAIVLMMGCGIFQLSTGKPHYLGEGFEGSTTHIALAFYGGLWSYYGWLMRHNSRGGATMRYFFISPLNILYI